MTTVLYTALAAVLALSTVILHEYGHARAMRKAGHPIIAAGIGLPFHPRLTIKARGKRTWDFTLSIWLIGAYVRNSDEQNDAIDKLPYRQFSWICGCGIIVNFILGFALLSLYSALQGHPVSAFITGLIAGLFYVLRRPAASYLVPLVGPAALALVAWSTIFLTVENMGDGDAKYMGPIGIGQVLVSHNLAEAILLAGAVSVSVGIFNSIPLFPLDGGQIATRIARNCFGERGEKIVGVTGFALAAALFAYVILFDVALAIWK